MIGYSGLKSELSESHTIINPIDVVETLVTRPFRKCLLKKTLDDFHAQCSRALASEAVVTFMLPIAVVCAPNFLVRLGHFNTNQRISAI